MNRNLGQQFPQQPDESASVSCAHCGTGGAHVQSGDHVLLHRGIADYGGPTDMKGQPWKSAEHMLGEEGSGGDLHKEYGSWWGTKDAAAHYGGESGVAVSAWFPKDKLQTDGSRIGHIVPEGVSGHVHEVQVADGGKWKALPHTPGLTVKP